MIIKYRLIVALLGLIAAAAGCGSPREQIDSADAGVFPFGAETGDREPTDPDFALLEEEMAEQTVDVRDPLKGWNRLMFRLNDRLYVYVGRPVLRGYARVVPEPVRVGTDNFFTNLTMPIRAVNSLLQGDCPGAWREVARFAVNTTVGILGVRDIALTKYGMAPAEEDLGQTLGRWRLGDGLYLVWPIFGPATLRDSVGRVGDSFLNPISYLEPCQLSAGVKAAAAANTGSLHLEDYEAITEDAIDPYIAIRQAYLQYRRQQLEE